MFRLKHVWEVIPLPSKLKLMWSRLTSSRLATFYFIMTVAHCIIQVTFQMTAYMVNTNAAVFLNELVDAGGLQSRNFTLYDANEKVLRSCWGVPHENEGEKCITIWAANGMVIPSVNAASSVPSISLSSVSTLTATPVLFPSATSSTSMESASVPAVTATVALEPISPIAAVSPSGPSGNVALYGYDVVVGLVDDSGEDDSGDREDRAADLGEETSPSQSIPTPTAVSHPLTTFAISNVVYVQPPTRRSISISSISAPSNATGKSSEVTGLKIKGIKGDEEVAIDLECVQVLRWPLQTLKDTQREDIVFVCFQIWVLGMSFVALLNESIPHIVAALLTHFLATIWSAFQLASTRAFRSNFVTLSTNGACKGVNLLPSYWKDRGVVDISMLVLNVVALLASALLSWKIVRSFGWATFRRIGADRKINRIYTVVLLMTVFLQLSLFFIVTSMALWIDELCFGSIGIFSSHKTLYKVFGSCGFALLVPWITLGWVAVRKESRKLMFAFLGISVILLGGWASEFLCDTWRLTFMNWEFFAIMSVVAATLTITVTILGVICLRNFGEGLSNYLKPEEKLIGEDFQRIISNDIESTNSRSSSSSNEEKVSFPEMSVVPSYTMPATIVPVRVPTTTVPARAFQQSVTVRQQPAIARPSVVAGIHLRSSSTISTSTHASDLDPFHFTDKLSPTDTKYSLRAKSRWSKDSSERGGRRLVSKRWVIE